MSVIESARAINADDAAYRQCGHDRLSIVMVSSASYANLPGTTPAVLSRFIYRTLIPSDGITGLTISDSFESRAIAGLQSPAMRAINAGLDMVMYPDTESASATAYHRLLQDAEDGMLSTARVEAAAEMVLALKRSLHLG